MAPVAGDLVGQALLVKVFAGAATGATVAAYSVGQQIAIAVWMLAIGFGALVFIFRFRSFKEVIAAGRAHRDEEKFRRSAEEHVGDPPIAPHVPRRRA